MMKRDIAALNLLSLSLFILVSFTNHIPKPLQKQPLKRIVIDAGHGGTDVGAKGAYSTEKDLCLAISLKLEKMMQDQLPDIDVFMTRKTDIYDNVTRKAEIANQIKGDLFLCIHVNSAKAIRQSEFIGYRDEVRYKGRGKKKKKYTVKVKEYRHYNLPNPAKGTETFIYNVNKTNGRMNALSKDEDFSMDSATQQEMKEFERNDPAKMMLLSMKTQTYFQRSADLALTIEDEFKKIGRISREAKQRKEGIFVLHAVNMPAVLVETGFISNPEEEDYLNSEDGQREICEVIIKAIKRYKYSLEKQLTNTGTTTPSKRK
ncbi:MAG: N-acetylmuramoyl-L-alanine amidase [Sphingobacteriia bacterium]|nr:MAG: N-acetylmuramoyl-L-alanine amidase [Sphingobacteriia bacterium]TAH09284.1 MAG: N-acetylmuramoyl-L-alanine amidase [Sphingobacteriia bacterium]